MKSMSVMVLAAVIAAAPFAQSPQPPLVKADVTKQVTDHVWVISDGNVPMVPNVGIVVGSRATLVVDTGLGPRNAETILKEVAKVSRHTELYLVATHYHPEHAGGSSAFPATAKFVVSKAEQLDIDELGMGMMQRFSGMSAFNADLLRGVTFRKPDVVFDREYVIDLGGVKATLRSLGPTHTRGDTSVFVEPDRVLFAGDIVMNHAFMAFSDQSSGAAWIAVLQQLEPLKPGVLVPSHGSVGDASLITLQRTVLSSMQTRVRELKGQGKTVDEAVTTVTTEFTAKYPDWTTPARIAGAVRSFYGEAK